MSVSLPFPGSRYTELWLEEIHRADKQIKVLGEKEEEARVEIEVRLIFVYYFSPRDISSFRVSQYVNTYQYKIAL